MKDLVFYGQAGIALGILSVVVLALTDSARAPARRQVALLVSGLLLMAVISFFYGWGEGARIADEMSTRPESDRAALEFRQVSTAAVLEVAVEGSAPESTTLLLPPETTSPQLRGKGSLFRVTPASGALLFSPLLAPDSALYLMARPVAAGFDDVRRIEVLDRMTPRGLCNGEPIASPIPITGTQVAVVVCKKSKSKNLGDPLVAFVAQYASADNASPRFDVSVVRRNWGAWRSIRLPVHAREVLALGSPRDTALGSTVWGIPHRPGWQGLLTVSATPESYCPSPQTVCILDDAAAPGLGEVVLAARLLVPDLAWLRSESYGLSLSLLIPPLLLVFLSIFRPRLRGVSGRMLAASLPISALNCWLLALSDRVELSKFMVERGASLTADVSLTSRLCAATFTAVVAERLARDLMPEGKAFSKMVGLVFWFACAAVALFLALSRPSNHGLGYYGFWAGLSLAVATVVSLWSDDSLVRVRGLLDRHGTWVLLAIALVALGHWALRAALGPSIPHLSLLKLFFFFALPATSYHAIRAVRADQSPWARARAMAAVLVACAAFIRQDFGIGLVCVPGVIIAVAVGLLPNRLDLRHAMLKFVVWGMAVTLICLALVLLMITGADTWEFPQRFSRWITGVWAACTFAVGLVAVVHARERWVRGSAGFIMIAAGITIGVASWQPAFDAAALLLARSVPEQKLDRMAPVSPDYVLLRTPEGFEAHQKRAALIAPSTSPGQEYRMALPGDLTDGIENDYVPALIAMLGTPGALRTLSLLYATIFGSLVWCALKTARHARGLHAVLVASMAIQFVTQLAGPASATIFLGMGMPGAALDSPSNAWVFFAVFFVVVSSATEANHSNSAAASQARIAHKGLVRFAAVGATLAAIILIAHQVARFVEKREDARARDAGPVGHNLRLAREYAASFRCTDPLVVVPPGPGTGKLTKLDRSSPSTQATALFDTQIEAAWSSGGQIVPTALSSSGEAGKSCVPPAPLPRSWEVKPSSSGCEARFQHGIVAAHITSSRQDDGSFAFNCCVEGSSETPCPTRRHAREPGAYSVVASHPKQVAEAISLTRGIIVSLLPVAAASRAIPAQQPAGYFEASSASIAPGAWIAVQGGDRVRAWVAADAQGTFLLIQPRNGRAPVQRVRPGELADIGSDAVILPVSSTAIGAAWLLRLGQSSLLADTTYTVRINGFNQKLKHPWLRLYPWGETTTPLGWAGRGEEWNGIDGAIAAASAISRDSLDSICSKTGGGHQCESTLRPDLQSDSRALIEALATAPADFAPDADRLGWHPALSASVVIIDGASGGVLVDAVHDPLRGASALSPPTPERVETLRAKMNCPAGDSTCQRESYDPCAMHGPGSIFKSFLCSAVVDTYPALKRYAVVRGAAPSESCEHGQPLLGYCLPGRTARTFWEGSDQPTGVVGALTESKNSTCASLFFLGLTLERGASYGWGDRPASSSVLATNPFPVGSMPTSSKLWISIDGRPLLDGRGNVHLDVLKSTRLWAALEQRMQLALAIAPERTSANFDRRAISRFAEDIPEHVARSASTGARSFSFHSPTVSIADLINMLRGAPLYPTVSDVGTAVAFSALTYGRNQKPLAPSWLVAPDNQKLSATWPCVRGRHFDDPIREGLCEVLWSGTARALPSRLPSYVVLYGAKTGTTATRDPLSEQQCNDLGRRVQAVVPSSRAFRCASELDRKRDLADSMLVLSFGISAQGKIHPYTMAIRFEGVGGTGFAVRAADTILSVLAPSLLLTGV